MAVSLRLSSARPPRSVMRVSAISEMMSSKELASEMVRPVQVMSPMVRQRTRRVTTSSVGFSVMQGSAANH